MISCKNCAHAFEGKYCPSCGQKASTKRFSTKILFADLIDKLLPLDRGVLLTAYQLVTRPGAMLYDYLEGKRVKFTKPFQFLLIMVAVSLIFFPQEALQRSLQDNMQKTSGSDQGASQALSGQILEWISANMTVLIISMIPFIALMAAWIFRKRGRNYAEHVIVGCYLVGGSTLVGMPLMLYLRITGANAYSPGMSGIFGVIFIGYYIWGYIGLFPGHRFWNTGLKSILIVLLGYIVYMLVALLCVGVAVKIYLKFGGQI